MKQKKYYNKHELKSLSHTCEKGNNTLTFSAVKIPNLNKYRCFLSVTNHSLNQWQSWIIADFLTPAKLRKEVRVYQITPSVHLIDPEIFNFCHKAA